MVLYVIMHDSILLLVSRKRGDVTPMQGTSAGAWFKRVPRRQRRDETTHPHETHMLANDAVVLRAVHSHQDHRLLTATTATASCCPRMLLDLQKASQLQPPASMDEDEYNFDIEQDLEPTAEQACAASMCMHGDRYRPSFPYANTLSVVMPQTAPEQPEQQHEEIIPQGKVRNYRQVRVWHVLVVVNAMYPLSPAAASAALQPSPVCAAGSGSCITRQPCVSARGGYAHGMSVARLCTTCHMCSAACRCPPSRCLWQSCSRGG